jgi:thiol:disulfide interchange protein DsbD
MISKLFKKMAILSVLQVIMIIGTLSLQPVYAQDRALDMELYSGLTDTAKLWVSYGPKDTSAYSFWYGSQNGVEANWTLPEGYSLGEVIFPTITEAGDPNAPTFVFAGNSRIIQQIIRPENNFDASSSLEVSLIALRLVYGDCTSECVTRTEQAQVDVNASLTPLPSDASTTPSRKRGAWVRSSGKAISIGIHKAYNDDGQVDRAFFLPIDATMFAGVSPLRLDAFNDVGFFSTFQLKHSLAGDAKVPGILVLDKPTEGGLNSFYIAPKNDFARAGTMPEGFEGTEIAKPASPPTSLPSYLVAILLALVGGLILNVMPCVFPVLALKVFSIVNLNSADEGEVRKDALAYTAGVILTFALLAVILISARSAGEAVGWGFQLQTPIFVMAMAILFFTMGLNFLGFFEVPSFFSNTGQSLTQKKGVKGSFFTGTLATLVAAPCTAPFMATAVAFALAQPSIKAISIFMALGLGLALPYLIIGFFPASRRFLPKPGKWMVTFRSFLAFPVFAAMVWMVWVLSIQTGSKGVLLVLSSMLAIGLVVWASKLLVGTKKGLVTLVSVVALVYTVASIRTVDVHTAQITNGMETYVDHAAIGDMQVIPFSHERLAELRNDGKNVFIHYWAAWCMICLMHENLVFSQDGFQTFLVENNIVFMQADRTNNDPELLRFMEKTYGRSSQPIDVFYTSDLSVEPIVLPTMFTIQKVTHVLKERLNEVNASAK